MKEYDIENDNYYLRRLWLKLVAEPVINNRIQDYYKIVHQIIGNTTDFRITLSSYTKEQQLKLWH